jgi:hypothetical protein
MELTTGYAQDERVSAQTVELMQQIEARVHASAQRPLPLPIAV